MTWCKTGKSPHQTTELDDFWGLCFGCCFHLSYSDYTVFQCIEWLHHLFQFTHNIKTLWLISWSFNDNCSISRWETVQLSSYDYSNETWERLCSFNGVQGELNTPCAWPGSCCQSETADYSCGELSSHPDWWKSEREGERQWERGGSKFLISERCNHFP